VKQTRVYTEDELTSDDEGSSPSSQFEPESSEKDCGEADFVDEGSYFTVTWYASHINANHVASYCLEPQHACNGSTCWPRVC
jgi:hypothetical protein